MPNRKLLEIVRHISLPQRKRLRAFVQAGLYPGGYSPRVLTDLLDRIFECGAEEEHPNLDKVLLQQQFFPGKAYKDKEKNQLDVLASDLFRVTRKFILLDDLEKEAGEEGEDLALARFYREANLDERFWQTVQTLRKRLDTAPDKSARHFFNRFLLEENVANFQSIFNSLSDDANLRATHRYLDIFYATRKLEIATSLEMQRTMSHLEPGPESFLTEAVVNLLTQHVDYLHTTVIEAFRLILETLRSPERLDQNIELLEKQIADHRAEIPLDVMRNLQAFVRVFRVRQYYRDGATNALEPFFELCVQHLEQGYLYVGDKILPSTLKMMVTTAIKIGKLDWIKPFLEAHKPDRITGTRFPEETHRLCMAELYFAQQEYAAAQNELIYRQFDNSNYNLLAEVLLLKIYYETQDELFDSRVKALDQKVRRSHIASEGKTRYFNFLKKVDKLPRTAWDKKSPKMQKLAEEIKVMTDLLEREWLLDCLKRS